MKTLSRNLSAMFKPPGPKRANQLHRAAREKAKLIASTLHVELERRKGESGLNVWPTKPLDADPFEGDHYAEDWQDALLRLNAYAAIATLVR